jgi:hypothetical protein
MRMREADGLANERLVSFPSARPGLGNPGTLPYVHGTGTANGTVGCGLLWCLVGVPFVGEGLIMLRLTRWKGAAQEGSWFGC